MLARRAVVLLASGLISPALADVPASEAGDCLYRSASGVEAYVGVVPAQITKGHEPTQPEGPMHGGVPPNGHQYHLVAAVFDVYTGERITDASVTAKVSGLNLAGPTKALEPMAIAGTITYGAYFNLASIDFYTIALTIKRSVATQAVTLNLTCDHRSR
jgi:hypothetical protein